MLIGCDHSALEIKKQLIEYIKTEFNIECLDVGTYSLDSCDYPDIAQSLCKQLLENKESGSCTSDSKYNFGILICGTGIGMSMTANKFPNIRSALCFTPFMAQMAKEHNNANILTFGSRTTKLDTMKEMIKIFIESDFQGGRHQRRIDKII